VEHCQLESSGVNARYFRYGSQLGIAKTRILRSICIRPFRGQIRHVGGFAQINEAEFGR